MKRRYLTHHEVLLIMKATSFCQHEIRDRCMVLMCYIHGLRVSELTGLKISDIDLITGAIYMRRLKKGLNTMHPLQATEITLLKEWLSIRNKYRKNSNPDWLFLSASGTRLTRQSFYKMLRKYAILAGLPVPANPHMLRHACGFSLADQGMDTRLIQDYLGHRNIRHTVHYTSTNAARFSRAWEKTQLYEC
ncbi:tyrosine-type recombinase/integrase (plasmid) [Enterobacter sp. JBIWA008]|uniref:tyrosine-type DNA invertase n=1 Tax=Enterobacter sp. JBIWA008 TaxID=2831892 RepID=UPI001CBAF028|nr:tyrosine-type DNA invertase [Enterobacter sp. JBIWA008]UAN43321.1 tyrosine-type recombinase/integrase [Enterobacter sp. JBIWA008]